VFPLQLTCSTDENSQILIISKDEGMNLLLFTLLNNKYTEQKINYLFYSTELLFRKSGNYLRDILITALKRLREVLGLIKLKNFRP
jgi:hypothetical protein